MIKEENSGTPTNFIQHFIKWALSVLKGLENVEMGQKSGTFYRINKEQGKETWKMNKEQGS